MGNDREYLYHGGDACFRCKKSRPGQPIRDATHYGMCALCWLGATASERRQAKFGEEVNDTHWTPDMMKLFELEELFRAPNVKPTKPPKGFVSKMVKFPVTHKRRNC